MNSCGTITSGSSSSSTGGQWITTAFPGTGNYTTVTNVYGGFIQNVNVVVCQECSETTLVNSDPIECRSCGERYWGKCVKSRVVIAGRNVDFTNQAGRCPGCGCHNATRKLVDQICGKCGDRILEYYREDCLGFSSTMEGTYSRSMATYSITDICPSTFIIPATA